MSQLLPTSITFKNRIGIGSTSHEGSVQGRTFKNKDSLLSNKVTNLKVLISGVLQVILQKILIVVDLLMTMKKK